MKKQFNPVTRRVMFLIIASLILCSYYTPLHAQTKVWDRRFGGSEFESCSTSIPTHDGGYLLCGSSSSGIGGDKSQASRGGIDFWIVKINAKGNKVWDKRFGGKTGDDLSSVVSTSDGGFLLGGWSDSEVGGDKSQPSRGWDDFWILKINGNGVKLWDKRFGGDHIDHLLSMRPTPDGGFLLGGSSYSGVSGDVTEPSRGADDFWVVKIDHRGNKLWDKRYGGELSDLLTEIIVTPDGGFLLAGRSASSKSGEKTEATRGEYDFWIVKTDADGNKLWDKTYGGDQYELPGKLLSTPDGGFLIGGATDSEINGDVTEPSRGTGWDDFWVVKTDADGNKLWDKRFGGNVADGLTSIEPTSDGNFLLGGWSYSDISGEKTEPSHDWGDFWMVKMDASGNKLWDKTYGGDLYEAIYNINPMPHGNFLLVGASQTGINGDKTQSSRGGYDFWIIKFNPRPRVTFYPIDIVIACDPICPILDLDIRTRYFRHMASFSFRIKLPEGMATFNKSGHSFNPHLRSDVSFEIEDANTMLVTWKNIKNISLKKNASLINASINILDNSKSFEACVSDVQAFNAKGKKVDVSSLCGTISFKNSITDKIANSSESVSTEKLPEVSIYPNPVTDVFNLAIPQAGNYKIEICDARGKVLNKINVTTKENHSLETLDLQEFPSGLYLINVTNGKRTSVIKIIKR
ncbi:MAG: T9SS type A sorting domain-containing protein [Chryseolinea sp.]